MYFSRQYFIRIVLVIKASVTQFTMIANQAEYSKLKGHKKRFIADYSAVASTRTTTNNHNLYCALGTKV